MFLVFLTAENSLIHKEIHGSHFMFLVFLNAENS
jgi:hypothetical protein